jgi:hypothetical protein
MLKMMVLLSLWLQTACRTLDGKMMTLQTIYPLLYIRHKKGCLNVPLASGKIPVKRNGRMYKLQKEGTMVIK